MDQPDAPPTNQLARKLVIDLSIMTVIGVGLALIGPFGSFAEPLSFRLVSWLGFSYLGYAIYSPMGAVVSRLSKSLDLPPGGLWVLAVLIATIPMSVAVWSIGYLPGPVPKPELEYALLTYFYVLVIGGGITALFHALESRTAAPAGDSPSQSTSAPIELDAPRFLDRLPPALGTELIALEMEDHYVRAHTSLGSELVLMRMRDAIAELDGLEGAQVHRSWWVARGAVEDVRREGRNVRLVLGPGLEAPVSRAQVTPLKQLGWL